MAICKILESPNEVDFSNLIKVSFCETGLSIQVQFCRLFSGFISDFEQWISFDKKFCDGLCFAFYKRQFAAWAEVFFYIVYWKVFVQLCYGVRLQAEMDKCATERKDFPLHIDLEVCIEFLSLFFLHYIFFWHLHHTYSMAKKPTPTECKFKRG